MAEKKDVARDVYTKKEFVDRYAQTLKDQLGMKISKTKAWELAKVTVDTMFEMSFEKPLSLGGIGRLGYISSGRSAAKGTPKLLPRFKPSSRIEAALNAGGVEVIGEGDNATAVPKAPASLLSDKSADEADEDITEAVEDVATADEGGATAPAVDEELQEEDLL